MSNCSWEQVSAFQNRAEFQRFEEWISGQIRDGNAQELAVDERFSGQYWAQHWFIHKESNQVWRLALPEPPFAGSFRPLVFDLIGELMNLTENIAKSQWHIGLIEAYHSLREPIGTSGYAAAQSIYANLCERGVPDELLRGVEFSNGKSATWSRELHSKLLELFDIKRL